MLKVTNEPQLTAEELLGEWERAHEGDCQVEGCDDIAMWMNAIHKLCFSHLMLGVMQASPEKFAEDPERPGVFFAVEPGVN